MKKSNKDEVFLFFGGFILIGFIMYFIIRGNPFTYIGFWLMISGIVGILEELWQRKHRK